jgi:hypothetical protein
MLNILNLGLQPTLYYFTEKNKLNPFYSVIQNPINKDGVLQWIFRDFRAYITFNENNNKVNRILIPKITESCSGSIYLDPNIGDPNKISDITVFVTASGEYVDTGERKICVLCNNKISLEKECNIKTIFLIIYGINDNCILDCELSICSE